jgi:putative glutathione S-transferase
LSKILVDGEWRESPSLEDDGRFHRPRTAFHGWVSTDCSTDFPAEPNRYHLYVSLACPWAHRTLIVRKLKRLEKVISVSVVDPVLSDYSWRFSEHYPDPLHGISFLHEAYLMADPKYSGEVTVPVLWDKQQRCIVNNESSEIIRILNSAFDAWGKRGIDLYPERLRKQIDEINDLVYENVNDGVYRAGFARTQSAYEEAFDALFSALLQLESRLRRSRYLVGDRLTEADWRLFTTLVRFDAVYYGHFKCNLRRLVDFPNLWDYTRELFQMPGVAETVDLEQIKTHYYRSHRSLNPRGLVPKGPALEFAAAHERARFGG